MSAAAFISAPDCFVMLSDGCAYTLEEKSHLTSKAARKVWKLRRSTGLFWMGARVGQIDEIVSSVKGMSAEPAIHSIAIILEKGLANDTEAVAILDDNNPFNIFTFECQNGFTEYYRLFYHQDKFTPCYRGKISPGATGAMVVDSDPDFGAYVKKHNTPDKTPEDVALQAFAEMVNSYKAEGLHVGGQIYLETINPQTNEIQNY